MKKTKFLLIILLLIGTFTLVNLPAWGGVTGKIKGVVSDADTGEPLPGVNILIHKIWLNNTETDFLSMLGAATNNQGEFIILKVPPGIYSVSASMMGYIAVTQKQVRVSVDRTTTLNFSLQSTILDLGESVIIEASRDVIQIDVSATETYVTAEEYQNTPFANRIEDIIALQSGISGNIIEGDIKIRASDSREVAFLVDGMDMVEQKFNRPITSIQPGIVQEIQIIRNGFNAEYGQARAGVINVITKNPSKRFHFNVDYQFTPAQKPHVGRNKYDPNWNLWRLYAGPQAFEGDTLITPDGRYENIRIWEGWNKYADRLLHDNNPDNDLTAEEAYELWKWRHRPLKYGDLKGHNVDLSLSGGVPMLPWEANFLLAGKYEYHPFNYPQSRDHYNEESYTLKWINNLRSDIKLTLNGFYTEVKTVPSSNPNSPWDRENLISYTGADFPNYYPFYKPILNRYTSLIGAKFVHTISSKLFYEINLNHFYLKYWLGSPDSARAEDGRYFHGRLYYDPQSGRITKEKGADDAVSGYQMYGGGMAWENSWDRRGTLSASMIYQFHSAHELKAGFNFDYDQIREHRVYWHQEDSTLVFLKDYKVTPIEFGAFVQDKIEFQGMIANLGLRFDYFDPNTVRPDPYRALEYERNIDIYETFLAGDYPTIRAKPKYYFSPRLGVSHPLSQRSKIYFNYGHFVQTPRSFYLYVANANGADKTMLQMGNANLNFEKTIAYELGCDIGIGEALQLHFGAFYKECFDLAASKTFAHTDQSLVMDFYENYRYADVRGIEIEIRKSVGRFITGWLNYNYFKKSESNLTIPNLSENPIITDDPKVGIDGVLWGAPLSDNVNIEPYGRGVVTIMAPSGWGPKLKGYSILEDTHLSFQLFYQGGAHSRHSRQSFRDMYPNVWFKELDRYWADVRLTRMFQIKTVNLELYLDISNIFHTKFRYPPSGRSGEDYYDDLWESDRLDQVGTTRLTDPQILRTENDDVWWGKVKTYIFGVRIFL